MTDELATVAYDYELPPRLIAQHPAQRRDASRLMIVRGSALEHRIFADLAEYLRAGDVLVLNETRVISARLHGRRLHRETGREGGRVELLLLRPSQARRYDPRALRWLALAKPARRLHPGDRISFGEFAAATIAAEYDGGMREVIFDLSIPFEEFLARAGRLPLPPYVHEDTEHTQRRYQTVFAREPGSVAAPTASLHFTPALLERLAKAGVEMVKLVLDVGLATFRPITAARIDQHMMHAETYTIPAPAAEAISKAKREGRRVIAAGTTVVRALEGCVRDRGRLEPGPGETSLFITPGFDFSVVDGLITNFHLPRSTLLVLVCAFAGREAILRAYAQAVAREYRFFSFGDAMLLLP